MRSGLERGLERGLILIDFLDTARELAEREVVEGPLVHKVDRVAVPDAVSWRTRQRRGQDRRIGGSEAAGRGHRE
eukprot:2919043-Rhodomonas_salina.4